MRRRAEIAHHSVQGACNALRAARDAARECMTVAASLSINPADARSIRVAAEQHLQQVETALAAVEAAVRSAEQTRQVVDRAEITQFGMPVLPPVLPKAAGA
jgi:hypothetical protein